MSVVIVGGHDRMVRQYKDICREYGCKAKVFTQMAGGLRGAMGSPDLLVLFTSTMSHKMLRYALSELGNSMRPIMDAMQAWGTSYQQLIREAE